MKNENILMKAEKLKARESLFTMYVLQKNEAFMCVWTPKSPIP